MSNFSYYFIIIIVFIILFFAFINKTDAYTSFVNGAKKNMIEGIKILPYLLVMYVAIQVFKASNILSNITNNVIPKELIVEGIFRPISSHASLSVMLDIFQTYGVDSKEGIASTILEGGSDTTIYVMGLYFGTIGIKKTRHSYFVGLLCDLLCLILTILLFLFVI